MLTQERLKELFNYCQETGIFTWKRHSHRKMGGKAAGTPLANEYIAISVDSKRYLAHRLAWLYVHGRFPEKLIDHKDGNRTNNRIDNLREATHGQNLMNSRPRSKSGVKNVVWHEQNKKWNVRFKVKGKLLYFGQYETIEEATVVAKQKGLELHKEFARHA